MKITTTYLKTYAPQISDIKPAILKHIPKIVGKYLPKIVYYDSTKAPYPIKAVINYALKKTDKIVNNKVVKAQDLLIKNKANINKIYQKQLKKENNNKYLKTFPKTAQSHLKALIYPPLKTYLISSWIYTSILNLPQTDDHIILETINQCDKQNNNNFSLKILKQIFKNHKIKISLTQKLKIHLFCFFINSTPFFNIDTAINKAGKLLTTSIYKNLFRDQSFILDKIKPITPPIFSSSLPITSQQINFFSTTIINKVFSFDFLTKDQNKLIKTLLSPIFFVFSPLTSMIKKYLITEASNFISNLYNTIIGVNKNDNTRCIYNKMIINALKKMKTFDLKLSPTPPFAAYKDIRIYKNIITLTNSIKETSKFKKNNDILNAALKYNISLTFPSTIITFLNYYLHPDPLTKKVIIPLLQITKNNLKPPAVYSKTEIIATEKELSDTIQNLLNTAIKQVKTTFPEYVNLINDEAIEKHLFPAIKNYFYEYIYFMKDENLINQCFNEAFKTIENSMAFCNN